MNGDRRMNTATKNRMRGRAGQKSVERDEPREPPESSVPHTRAARVPDRPLDGFLVHPPGSFDPSGLWEPMLAKEQWDAARLLIGRGYVLGICANEEEAVAIACTATREIPVRIVVAYDDQDVLWLKRA